MQNKRDIIFIICSSIVIISCSLIIKSCADNFSIRKEKAFLECVKSNCTFVETQSGYNCLCIGKNNEN